jgi:23S rRNA pseudouridine1911/1915/1917 synthase
MPTDKPFTLAVRPNPSVALTILHEDPDLIIVDKPAGTVTQPGKGHANDSLLNGLFALHDNATGKLLHNLGERRDFGLLHRLDKDTSGLLVVAKSPNAYDQLRRDFEARKVDKEYYALTAGIPHPAQGVIQARLKEVEVPNEDPYAHRGASIKKVVISRQGQEAITVYKVLSHTQSPPTAVVQLTIKTGRLHQIRAHMMFLNCQVLGDNLYKPANLKSEISNSKSSDFPRPPRLCLHAFHLGFKHPTTNKWAHFYSPLPPDLTRYAAKLGLSPPVKA